jgi:rfaE bifunctional protein nucleotidyltransferase chain/domain
MTTSPTQVGITKRMRAGSLLKFSSLGWRRSLIKGSHLKEGSQRAVYILPTKPATLHRVFHSTAKSTPQSMNTFDKIFAEPRDLLATLQSRRDEGLTIVFGNGCFDLLHVGHTRYLDAAKSLGDVLIIAVNTERSIRSNPSREPPINSCEERMEVIAALDAVDYVVPLDDPLPIPLIELIRPDIQAKGTDYNLDQMPERFAVEACGGKIQFVGDEKTHSSSALREALRQRGAL